MSIRSRHLTLALKLTGGFAAAVFMGSWIAAAAGTVAVDSGQDNGGPASSVLGDDQRWPLGTVQGAVRVDEPLSVELPGEPLPRGLYRPEATVLIYPTNHTPDSPPLQGRRACGAPIQVA